VRSARLQVVTEGGRFQVYLDSVDEMPLKICWTPKWSLGAAAGKFDDKMQQTGSCSTFLIGKHQGSQARRHQPMTLPVTPWIGFLPAIT